MNAADDAAARLPTKFTVSTLAPGSFDAAGRRAFFDFRDLGIAEATGGRFGARVARGNGEAASTGWHYHPVDLQVIYVLKGYVDLAFENGQVIRADAGTCINIPGGMGHNELAFSDDLEVLEIASPAHVTNVAIPDPTASPASGE